MDLSVPSFLLGTYELVAASSASFATELISEEESGKTTLETIRVPPEAPIYLGDGVEVPMALIVRFDLLGQALHARLRARRRAPYRDLLEKLEVSMSFLETSAWGTLVLLTNPELGGVLSPKRLQRTLVAVSVFMGVFQRYSFYELLPSGLVPSEQPVSFAGLLRSRLRHLDRREDDREELLQHVAEYVDGLSNSSHDNLVQTVAMAIYSDSRLRKRIQAWDESKLRGRLRRMSRDRLTEAILRPGGISRLLRNAV